MRILLSLLLFALFAGPLPAAAAPLDEVMKSFMAYKAAIIESDGEAAAQLVTRGSRDYYRELADHALMASRADLDQLHLTDRLNVMLLRHSLDRGQLENMSGKEIVSYAVDEGWIGKEGAEQLQLGNYQVDGDSATGTILRPDGGKTTFKMEFLKQDGRWLLDLVALMKLTRVAFEFSVKQTGLSEDEFVLLMLEHNTGRKPRPDIWNPPS